MEKSYFDAEDNSQEVRKERDTMYLREVLFYVISHTMMGRGLTYGNTSLIAFHQNLGR